MAIINTDKPGGTEAFGLNIGSGFNLLIGSGFRLLINPGSGSFVNTDKASVGETWGTIETTWASETRTWLAASQLIENAVKPVIANPLWTSQLVWQMALPWQENSSIMNNTPKP